jgi:hypothetical protein
MAANTKERSAKEIQEKYLDSVIEQLSEDVSHEFEFGDRLLRKIISENREPTFSEMSFFKAKLGWDETIVSKQRRRMSHVMRHLAIVGTKSQRLELEEEQKTATSLVESEVPKLNEQIAKLEKQRSQLEKAAANAERRSLEVAESLEKLRAQELQREDILRDAVARSAHFNKVCGSRLNLLNVEVSHRKMCLNKPEEMETADWVAAIRTLAPECVQRNVSGQFQTWEIIEPAWSERRMTIVDEIALMQAEIETLEAEKQKFEESQRRVSEFYIEENK